MTNPYLEPVASVWTRVAGVAPLVAGAGLTAVLGYAVFDFVADGETRRALTSSSVIFGLILLALCGICWQAGYRNTWVTVVIPEILPARWWQNILHNQRAFMLKASLLFKKRVILIDVPYHLTR